jgi:DNA-binding MarR family transcriptional regulator
MPTTNEPFILALRQWAEIFMRHSMRDLKQSARRSGLSLPQLIVLLRLYRGSSCGVSEIGGHLGVTNAAASQMIERLVQLGLLERAEDAHDRRARNITLSAQGQRLVGENLQARLQWLENLSSSLSPEQQVGVAAALSILGQAMLELETRANKEV